MTRFAVPPISHLGVDKTSPWEFQDHRCKLSKGTRPVSCRAGPQRLNSEPSRPSTCPMTEPMIPWAQMGSSEWSLVGKPPPCAVVVSPVSHPLLCTTEGDAWSLKDFPRPRARQALCCGLGLSSFPEPEDTFYIISKPFPVLASQPLEAILTVHIRVGWVCELGWL